MKIRSKALLLTLFALCATVVLVPGCKNDDDNPIATPTVPDNNEPVVLHIYPTFGVQNVLLSKKFMNAAGDSVFFETLKFYVSEPVLVDTNGNSVELEGEPHEGLLRTAHETQTVWLVDFSDPDFLANGYFSITLNGPPGTYRGIKFSVGVPYNENHQDASTQTYPLGVDVGMYWGWNPGYIFHRIEGKVDSAGTPIDFLYHIGEDNRRATVTLANLTGAGRTEFIVSTTAANIFSVNVDYSSLFTAGLENPSGPIQLVANPSERVAHGGSLADRIFLNYSAAFSKRP